MSDYLWDRSAPVDPEVADLEARLNPLAFEARQHPLLFRPRRRRVGGFALGLAASIAVIAGLSAFHVWRLQWETNRPWSIRGGGAFTVGAPLRVGPTPTTVNIARLGVLQATPGTDLSLDETASPRHRLTMTRGAIDVRLWAPPGRVAVHTPAGDVVDLGCIFSLAVDAGGVAHLSVRTGWVELTNAHGDAAIPAGASASMSADREPQVPVYDDASAAFRGAVRAIESTTRPVDAQWLRTVAMEARPRDAITVLTLSNVTGLAPDVRTALLDTAQRLHQPPTADAVPRIIAGDRDLFWQWFDSLPLPRLKNWWANWRDALPR